MTGTGDVDFGDVATGVLVLTAVVTGTGDVDFSVT